VNVTGRVDGLEVEKAPSFDAEAYEGAVGAGDGSKSVVGRADGAYEGPLVDGRLVGRADGA
tara:strand:+ start:322 stop:504 length:183 start_codon:yes stop_codon:yes gene_type:complete